MTIVTHIDTHHSLDTILHW